MDDPHVPEDEPKSASSEWTGGYPKGSEDLDSPSGERRPRGPREDFGPRPMAIDIAISVAGGAAGAVIGYLIFWWLTGHGILAPALPGALLGLGAAYWSRHRSMNRGIACGVAAVAVGLFSYWLRTSYPLSVFVGNLDKLPKRVWVFVIFGAVMAYWFGQGKNR